MKDPKIRFSLRESLQGLDCLLILASVVVIESSIRLDDERKRVELSCTLDFPNCFFMSAVVAQKYGVPLVRACIVGIERESMAESNFGFRGIPIVRPLDIRKCGLCLGKCAVDL